MGDLDEAAINAELNQRRDARKAALSRVAVTAVAFERDTATLPEYTEALAEALEVIGGQYLNPAEIEAFQAEQVRLRTGGA